MRNAERLGSRPGTVAINPPADHPPLAGAARPLEGRLVAADRPRRCGLDRLRRAGIRSTGIHCGFARARQLDPDIMPSRLEDLSPPGVCGPSAARRLRGLIVGNDLRLSTKPAWRG